ncbi:MAG: serine--tRNA ligase, partial [Oscillospiraceae bacterium]|nr:serine--tRNA ligase [Oscillospiraceae bacterium]
MIDIRRIRDNPQEIIDKLTKRVDTGYADEIHKIVELDSTRRNLLAEANDMKAERNAVSKQIPKLKSEGKDVESVMISMRALGDKIEILQANLVQIEEQLHEYIISLPNLPDDDLVKGGKENNLTVSVFG